MSSLISPKRHVLHIAVALVPFLASVGGCSAASAPPLNTAHSSAPTVAAPTYLSTAQPGDPDPSFESSDRPRAAGPGDDAQILPSRRHDAPALDPLTLSTRPAAARDYRINLDVAYLYGPVHG